MPDPARFLLLAATTPILAAGAATAATAQQMEGFNFEFSDRNGICTVGIPAGDRGLKLEFSIRVRDFNINVTMHNIDGAIVDAALEAEREPRIALVFDGERRHDLDWGRYVAGFTYRAFGGWDNNADAADPLDDLSKSRTVTFIADKHSWGPIPLQTKGMAYNLLDDCVRRVSAAEQGN
jgi:hypothetical protein